jgi:glutathione S-transferase
VLKVYGHRQSRAFRTIWMVEELGLPYESIPLSPRSGETRKPEFLAINPNGHIPAIQDGDFVLWESMAINLYLATKYGAQSGLWPASVEEQGRALQWSVWAMTEVEPPLLEILRHRMMLPEAERREDVVKAATERLMPPITVLDGALQGRSYLLGSDFTVTDLNVASVLSWARFLRVDLGAQPRAADWLGRCMARPAAKKAAGS